MYSTGDVFMLLVLNLDCSSDLRLAASAFTQAWDMNLGSCQSPAKA